MTIQLINLNILVIFTVLDDACQVIDEMMQQQERLKNQRITTRSQAEECEGEGSDIKKRLAAQNKEITHVQKAITALETRIEQRRADRHSLLKACKVCERSVFGGVVS